MAGTVFIISEKEIKRRITAFTLLLASLYACTAVLSVITFPALVTEHRGFFLLTAAGILLLFAAFRLMTVRFFRTYRKTEITLTDTHLERYTPKARERFSLSEVTGIRIKNTSRGTVREIGIRFSGNGWQYFDGLENLEVLAERLIDRYGKQMKVVTSVEPVDYDSPAFYPALGLIVGAATVSGLKFISRLDITDIRMLYLAFGTYTAALGIYFLLAKPQAIRYGRKYRYLDYLIGIVMLGASVVMWIMTWQPLMKIRS